MTPMYFQYLVGLCCLRCNPDAIEMVLGDRVFDEAAEKDRDVDVTIKLTEPDGTRTAFMGYEARREKAPLDVTGVEQLCIKLNNMPDLTMRAVVSAEGYTESAIRKAKWHNIRLFTFKNWQREIQADFPEVSLQGSPTESILYTATEFRWVGSTGYSINRNMEGKSIGADLSLDSPLFREDQNPNTEFPTLERLVRAAQDSASKNLRDTEKAQSVLMAPTPIAPNLRPDGPVGDPIEFSDVQCAIMNPVYFREKGELHQIESISLKGSLQWFQSGMSAEFRVLIDLELEQVYAGAAICGHPDNADVMFAMVFAPDSANAHVRFVYLDEKQRNFIHKLKVRS